MIRVAANGARQVDDHAHRSRRRGIVGACLDLDVAEDSLAMLMVFDGQFCSKLPMSIPSRSVAWFSFSEPRRKYV